MFKKGDDATITHRKNPKVRNRKGSLTTKGTVEEVSEGKSCSIRTEHGRIAEKNVRDLKIVKR